MSELDATTSGTKANSYLSVAEADDLMDGFLQVGRWEDLDQDVKSAILRVGTRLIDQYWTWGEPAVQGQALAFPRKLDGLDLANPPLYNLRKEVKRALLEYVDFYLEDELTGLKKLQGERVSSASILSQNANFAEDTSGLPAGARRELDQLVAMRAPETHNRAYDGTTDSEAFFG